MRCCCARSTFSNASRGGRSLRRAWRRAQIRLELRAHLRARRLRQLAAHLRAAGGRNEQPAGKRGADLLGSRLRDAEKLEVLARTLEQRRSIRGAEPRRSIDRRDAAEPSGGRPCKARGLALRQADDQAVEILGRAGEGYELGRRLQHGPDGVLRVGGVRQPD
jgi:hypothetical protein